MPGLKILLTNDDGLNSNGMRHLEEGLAPIGEIWAVAPDRERSATSQAISLRETLRLTRVSERRYMVNGYPADCVNVALYSGRFPRFDLVISGVNHGPNLGDDVHYSGTVGAARHAIIHRIRAVAISAPIGDHRGEFHRIAAWFRGWILENFADLRDDVVYNINYPLESGVAPDAPYPLPLFTRHGRRSYLDSYEEIEDGGDYSVFRLKETVMGHREETDTDFAALSEGCISITPLGIQTTDMRELKRWIQKTTGNTKS
jgi:5'-nucleotidase